VEEPSPLVLPSLALTRAAGPLGGTAPADPIKDWRTLSAVPGRWRSFALRAIDRAVRALPEEPSERDLQPVLRAVSAWQRQKSPRSRRWLAVRALETAVLRQTGPVPLPDTAPGGRPEDFGQEAEVPRLPGPATVGDAAKQVAPKSSGSRKTV